MLLYLPLSIPYVTENMPMENAMHGMKLREKLLGKISPVALRSKACGMAVKSSIMIKNITISIITMRKANSWRVAFWRFVKTSKSPLNFNVP